MPLYEYRCPDNHMTERRVPFDTNVVTTCRCGKPATREGVYRINFGGYASTPQGQTDFVQDYRRFTEATSELDYKASRLESEGAKVATPNYFKAAKHEARKMSAAGVTADQITT